MKDAFPRMVKNFRQRDRKQKFDSLEINKDCKIFEDD